MKYSPAAGYMKLPLCVHVCVCVLRAGARRLLQWEQRIVLGARSGQVTTSTEVKVKLRVSAAELQQETGLSKKGLQHLLAVAGSRCAGAQVQGERVHKGCRAACVAVM